MMPPMMGIQPQHLIKPENQVQHRSTQRKKEHQSRPNHSKINRPSSLDSYTLNPLSAARHLHVYK